MISVSSTLDAFFNFIYISIPSPYLFFICCGVPMHWKLPRTIIPNLVESAYASYIEWVVRRTVASFFWVATLEITFHIKRRALGSIPVDG